MTEQQQNVPKSNQAHCPIHLLILRSTFYADKKNADNTQRIKTYHTRNGPQPGLFTHSCFCNMGRELAAPGGLREQRCGESPVVNESGAGRARWPQSHRRN